MIGNTGDTQPLKVPGLPLCMRFRGKPDDLKKITHQVDQALEKHLSDGSVDSDNSTAGPDQPDLLMVNSLPAKALPAKMAFQPAEDGTDAPVAAAPDAALTQASEEQSEENLLVIHPRPAERRAEDFMRDWMRRFTRS